MKKYCVIVIVRAIIFPLIANRISVCVSKANGKKNTAEVAFRLSAVFYAIEYCYIFHQ